MKEQKTAKEIFISDIPSQKPSREEIVSLLGTENVREITEMFRQADLVRKKYAGDEVHLRAIIEFSNWCRKNCCYCGLRKDNAGIRRYRMSPDEILDTARQAHATGFRTIVLQSGEDLEYPADELCSVIGRIKQELDVAVTLSFGERPFEEYSGFRKAGADRYLLKFETSDKKLYKKLKPDSNQEKRFKALKFLNSLGFQTGAGIMTGLPGQSLESVADDILLFDEFNLEMVGSGPFIVNGQTPLNSFSNGDLQTALKVIALTRLVTRNAHIPATTSIEVVHPEGRLKALNSGANVIMLNVTPPEYRSHYRIYPDTGRSAGKDMAEEYAAVRSMLESIGRPVSAGYGHGLKRKV